MLFTFHYVSIKSVWSVSLYITLSHLHSTMYLLNPERSVGKTRTHGNIFTFHYVSIKSPVDVASEIESLYLHSTMYLLNQHGNKHKCKVQFLFTFHYVSIKSKANTVLNHCLNAIYIPLCIY